MFERRLLTSHRAIAILFALALGALLVLRPVCVAQGLQQSGHAIGKHDHATQTSGVPAGDELQCCAVHADALFANVVDTAAGFANDASSVGLAAAALILFFVARTPASLRSRSASGALERIRPYHARTARALR